MTSSRASAACHLADDFKMIDNSGTIQNFQIRCRESKPRTAGTWFGSSTGTRRPTNPNLSAASDRTFQRPPSRGRSTIRSFIFILNLDCLILHFFIFFILLFLDFDDYSTKTVGEIVLKVNRSMNCNVITLLLAGSVS